MTDSRFPVSEEKLQNLLAKMKELDVQEEDLEESFIRGSGKGGQKRNKTSSCVQLKHLPTGFEVRCESSRSQGLNRYMARRLLCEKIEEVLHLKKSKARAAQEKIRRQKRKRSKRAKEKLLSEKRSVSVKKKLRKVSRSDSE